MVGLSAQHHDAWPPQDRSDRMHEETDGAATHDRFNIVVWLQAWWKTVQRHLVDVWLEEAFQIEAVTHETSLYAEGGKNEEVRARLCEGRLSPP